LLASAQGRPYDWAMIIVAAFLDNLWRHLHGSINAWTLFGLLGNAMFTSRFVVQWYASEKLKQSIIPKNFWHLSLVGGVIQLIYALHIGYVPVILGYLLPPVIAARNLMLIAKNKNTPSTPLPGAPLPDDGTAAPTAGDPPETADRQEMAANAG
jgi:lipid-A-disaccharide synthase-like uncharacterized protein